MYRFPIALLFILIYSFSFAQEEYEKIDQRAKQVPLSLRTTEEIAKYLTEGLETDKEKIRAIYTWIAKNIDYDVNLSRSPLIYGSSDELIQEVLKERKGVCQHYSELFNEMCNNIGIASKVISGYTKKNGRISNLGHAWNAVLLDSNYYLLDPTWAAGYVEGNRFYREFREDFFLIEPEEFILTHIPFDPMWQFLWNPVSHVEVASGDFTDVDNEKGDFIFKDSILHYESESEVEQLTQTKKRIENSGITNPLIRNHIAEISVQLSSAMFNKAVDTLNYGINHLNRYIDAKNKQFNQAGLDEKGIVEMLKNAASGIFMAEKILKGLASANQELNALIITTKRQTSKLISQLEKEDTFMQKNMEEWRPLKMQVMSE